MNIEHEIRSYLSSSQGLREASIDRETPLFSGGYLDSFAVLAVVTFLEAKFLIKFHGADISLENLDSISRMSDFIRKQGATKD